MNTHRALIEHADNQVTLIAGGSEEQCRKSLEKWISQPGVNLDVLDEPMVVKVIHIVKT